MISVHTTVLWACAAIAVAVFAVMIHSIATFRKVADDRPARGSTREIMWAIIPIIIMVMMAAPAVTNPKRVSSTPAYARSTNVSGSDSADRQTHSKTGGDTRVAASTL